MPQVGATSSGVQNIHSREEVCELEMLGRKKTEIEKKIDRAIG